MGLSIMEEVPGWEQALRAFNQNNHESYIESSHWVGESNMDNIIPTEMPLAISGLGDDAAAAGGQNQATTGWGVAQNIANTALNVWQQNEKAKLDARNAAIQARLQKQKQQGQGGAGGGGGLFGMSTSTLLLVGAVVIGGVFLFSMLSKKKGGGEAHAS